MGYGAFKTPPTNVKAYYPQPSSTLESDIFNPYSPLKSSERSQKVGSPIPVPKATTTSLLSPQNRSSGELAKR